MIFIYAFLFSLSPHLDCNGNGNNNVYEIKDTIYIYHKVLAITDTVGLLFLNDQFVDSVKLDSSPVSVVADSIVYKSYKKDQKNYFTLYDGIKKLILDNHIPKFNSFYSNPVLCKDNLYYWGIDENNSHMYVSRYNFTTQKLDTTFVTVDQIATDMPEYYYPVIRGDTIYFAFYDSVVMLDKLEFKLITQ